MRRRFLGFRSRSWVALAPIAMMSALCWTNAARAASCDDLKGKPIFEDTFADDSGGWDADNDPKSKMGGGTYTIHMDPKYSWNRIYNNTFNASDADYCMEFVMPKSVAPDNPVQVGLFFWSADGDNSYEVDFDSTGQADLGRTTAGKWNTIFNFSDPSLKATPGSVAVIRVQTAGGTIAPSVNGVALKKVRAQIPNGPLSFGIYLQTTKDNPGISVDVKRFKVAQSN